MSSSSTHKRKIVYDPRCQCASCLKPEDDSFHQERIHYKCTQSTKFQVPKTHIREPILSILDLTRISKVSVTTS